MKDLPIKVVKSPIEPGVQSVKSEAAGGIETVKAKNSLPDSDASILSLPRTKPNVLPEQNVDSLLVSFLNNLGKELDLSFAHKNLDPSRVVDLLSGTEE